MKGLLYQLMGCYYRFLSCGGFIIGSIFSSVGDIIVCQGSVVLSSKWIVESGSPGIVASQSYMPIYMK